MWKPWSMGWGEDKKLANGWLTLSAYKNSGNDKFRCEIFGNKLKKEFDSIEEAKEFADNKAKLLLAKALQEMGE